MQLRGGNSEMADALRAGVPTITISGQGPNGEMPYWHQVGDTVDKLDPEVMVRAHAFVWTYLQALDAQKTASDTGYRSHKRRPHLSGKPQAKQAPVGYDDTPWLPGGKWRVHDSRRPQPPVIDPGTASTQAAPGRPPSDAIVLFDGQDTSQWVGRDGGPVSWTVADGMMEVLPRTGGIQTVQAFGDIHLHIEWAAPTEVKGASQGRGNSGVFLMGLYEIQVLDSYDNPTYADGHTGAIYGQYPPLTNAARKPGEWQSYDIFFTAPRFDGETLVSPAYATVVFNGVLLHNHQELMGPTGHKTISSYAEPHGPTGPISLQDHGDLVRFRNIWVRPIGSYS